MNLLQRNQFPLPHALAACLGGAVFAILTPVLPAAAQTTAAATRQADVPPRTWIDAAAANELRIIKNDGSSPLRYRSRKVDSKQDITREVVESRDGSVARLLERNGQKLTAQEDAAERERLNQILASPQDFIRHHKRDDSNRDESLQMVKLMPQAMIFTYAPGQPQLPGVAAPQVVLDFTPDPAFRPPNMASDLLTGLAGRVWIDRNSRRMTCIEGHVLHPVNFGWGLVGRIYPGGTIELEQTSAGGERWVYSRLNMHLSMRVVVKTVDVNDKMTATDFQPLPAPVSLQEAVHMLLAMPVPLR